MQRLKTLILNRTEVSDEGLIHLKGLTLLKSLDLQYTQVTRAGIAELQKAMPNCTIEHSLEEPDDETLSEP